MKRLNKYWYFAISILVFMFIASSIPTKGIQGIPHIDKLIHFCVFGFYAFILNLAFNKQENIYIKNRNIKYVVILIVLLSSVFDELHQLLTPYRSFELLDIVADLSGAFFILLIDHFIKKYKFSQKS